MTLLSNIVNDHTLRTTDAFELVLSPKAFTAYTGVVGVKIRFLSWTLASLSCCVKDKAARAF